jgi:hypothetical protein
MKKFFVVWADNCTYGHIIEGFDSQIDAETRVSELLNAPGNQHPGLKIDVFAGEQVPYRLEVQSVVKVKIIGGSL